MLQSLAIQPNTDSLVVLSKFMANPSRRYLFGATPYAAGIISTTTIQGVIDDHLETASFYGVPVIRMTEAPEDALVVSTIIGRPHTASWNLREAKLEHCDYFTFHRYSDLELPRARFWTGFGEDASEHISELELVRKNLVDEPSREVLDSILNFRLSANTDWIRSFRENQVNQYFEPFLNLMPTNESFVDVGCFDGQTTADFIARCPEFNAVYIFEPDPCNFSAVQKRFNDRLRVHCYRVGLADSRRTERFSSSGSTSGASVDGEVEIQVDTLDSFGIDCVSFLKMDIEGAELAAIAGARETIIRCHPRLAISVYHQPSDLWRVPQEVLAIRDDYELFLRHYTEGVTETVMFFLPKH